MSFTDRIIHQFVESLESSQHSADYLIEDIEAAADLLTITLLSEGKIMTCGNGFCHLEATRLTTLLCHKFELERPALPAFTLNTDTTLITAVANGQHFNEVYAKQVSALGNENDLLVIYSVSGNSAATLRAVQAAHEKGIRILAFTANGGGDIAALLSDDDMEIRIDAQRSARILESFMLINHCLADVLDAMIFGLVD